MSDSDEPRSPPPPRSSTPQSKIKSKNLLNSSMYLPAGSDSDEPRSPPPPRSSTPQSKSQIPIDSTMYAPPRMDLDEPRSPPLSRSSSPQLKPQNPLESQTYLPPRINVPNLRQLTEKVTVVFEELPLNMLLLKNEESKLIEVMECHGKARFKGVKVGDVVVDINGRRLDVGLHHDDFASMMSKANFPVRFSLWRAAVPSNRYIDIMVSWNGGDVAIIGKHEQVDVGSSPHKSVVTSATVVTLTKPRNLILENNGYVFCSEVDYASRSTSLLKGDLLVGFMHVPLAPNLDGNGLIEMLSLHHGPEVYLNVWRPSSQGRPSVVPKIVSPVKSPLSLKKQSQHNHPLSKQPSIKSKNSSSGGGLESLAAEAPLSLSSMMDMMGSSVSMIGDIANSTVEVITTTATGTALSPSIKDFNKAKSSGRSDDIDQVEYKPSILSRQMHYSDDPMSEALYAVSSNKTPWIFEQCVWCGNVECEWHEEDNEDEDDDNDAGEEPSSPLSRNLSDEASPRGRSSSFHSPKPVRRKPRGYESASDDLGVSHVIDATVLVTEASIFFIHPSLAWQYYQTALKLTPEMLLDIALPYYTVMVNGDEVAVRSSEVQLRLKESALASLDLDTTSQWHYSSNSTMHFSSQSPQSSSSPLSLLPPWHQSSKPSNKNKLNTSQYSLILCTASNMHRAELLETITQWYEDSMGESLSVEQVPYLGSPPAAKPSLTSNGAGSLLASLSSRSTSQQQPYISTSISSERPSVSDSMTSESQPRGDSMQSLDSQSEEILAELGAMSLPSSAGGGGVVLSAPPPKSKRGNMFGLFKKKGSKSKLP